MEEVGEMKGLTTLPERGATAALLVADIVTTAEEVGVTAADGVVVGGAAVTTVDWEVVGGAAVTTVDGEAVGVAGADSRPDSRGRISDFILRGSKGRKRRSIGLWPSYQPTY